MAMLGVGMSAWAGEISTIYSKTLSGWESSDVTKTEGTLDKWYNATGIVSNDVYTGMMINATYGLRLAARNTTATATLTLNRTANTIVTIDAVWNVGSASSDSNTPNNKFTYGDFTIQQNVRSNNLTTTYKINGVTTTVGTDKFARENDMTIHLKVNSVTNEITEFYLKNGETTVAQFSDLSSSNNHFAAGSNYDALTLTSWMSGSSAYTWCALKSITVQQETQVAYSYTVKAKSGSTTFKTITEGVGLSGSTIYYHYNQVMNINGTLYQAAADGNGYKSNFTLDSDNKEVTKSYSQPATPITNLMFLAEGEDLFTKGTGSAADSRCSMGAGGYASSKTAFVTLPAGTYYMVLSNRCSGNRTGIHKFYKGSDADPFFSADGSGYNAIRESGEFTLGETTTLYMQGGDGNQFVDWIYIYGTPDPVSVTLGTNGYATFASPYPLDLTSANRPTGLTAYKASVSGTTVTFTELNQTVPANTGILLKGTASTSYNIPVVATGTTVTENAFLVNEGGTTFTAESGYTYFGLIKDSTPLTFGKFEPNSVAIPANKAYLKVADSNLSRLNVAFADDEASGISATLSNSEERIANSKIYNLNGQRVDKPAKGLYIVNGKKVIKN